jgi:uridine kinase
MPAGLDGHPDPIRSVARAAVIDDVAARVAAVPVERCLVGIDGASGTGKSTLADELAAVLRTRGLTVVRASTDSFHRPRVQRYRRGPTSPEGYYVDSHDLGAITSRLLEPFAAGAEEVVTATFDEPADRAVDPEIVPVPGRAVLVFDGLFVHRPELVGHWHLSVFLVADARRQAAWQRYLADGGSPELARRDRYVRGQELYELEAAPRSKATLVIDNDDLAAPAVL